jgi:hypothetical protein
MLLPVCATTATVLMLPSGLEDVTAGNAGGANAGGALHDAVIAVLVGLLLWQVVPARHPRRPPERAEEAAEGE